MQQTFGLKRLVATHVGATVMALGVLVSSGLAMAGLTATGNVPWMSGSSAPIGAQQPAIRAQHTAQLARFYEVKMAGLEADELHAATVMAQSMAHETLRRFYAHKEERQDVVGMQVSALAARATQQETLRRFYAHKEERLLELSTPAAAASTLHSTQGFDHADAIAALRATPRMNAALGWAPTPDGCSCPPAGSWTLLDDLTPVRVWR